MAVVATPQVVNRIIVSEVMNIWEGSKNHSLFLNTEIIALISHKCTLHGMCVEISHF